MPELPEVEVVRRGLVTHLTGATLRDVDVLHPRTGRRYPGGSAALAQALEGATIAKIDRRGKYLWCVLVGESTHLTPSLAPALLIHLGMSGRSLSMTARLACYRIAECTPISGRGAVLVS